jgi:hypothetical protein
MSRNLGSIPTGAIHLFLHRLQGPPSFLVNGYRGRFSSEVMRLQHVADHSSSSCAGVTMLRSPTWLHEMLLN